MILKYLLQQSINLLLANFYYLLIFTIIMCNQLSYENWRVTLHFTFIYTDTIIKPNDKISTKCLFLVNLVTANYVLDSRYNYLKFKVKFKFMQKVPTTHQLEINLECRHGLVSDRSNYHYLYLLGVELPTDTYTIIQSYGSDTRCLCIKY